MQRLLCTKLRQLLRHNPHRGTPFLSTKNFHLSSISPIRTMKAKLSRRTIPTSPQRTPTPTLVGHNIHQIKINARILIQTSSLRTRYLPRQPQPPHTCQVTPSPPIKATLCHLRTQTCMKPLAVQRHGANSPAIWPQIGVPSRAITCPLLQR